MDQTLSLYLMETVSLLDPAAPDYALDLITLVESILEDPDLILRKKLDKIKGQAVAEMKMQGMDYDQRMEELEKLEYPKPKREFIYSTFNSFADRHPWVGQENIRPKSIARKMFESFRSFADYVRDYELQRAEGLLLRHLSSVHKVLLQTVPDTAKTDAVREMELYLGTMIRQVDSSIKYARVGVMNDIGESIKPDVVILLIGERPGLGRAESMSAYMAYKPKTGDTGADRDVVCNIFENGGTNPLEAGAFVIQIAQKMMKHKASGVKLKTAS